MEKVYALEDYTEIPKALYVGDGASRSSVKMTPYLSPVTDAFNYPIILNLFSQKKTSCLIVAPVQERQRSLVWIYQGLEPR